MFCSRCGYEIKGEARFCPKCGNPLNIQGTKQQRAGQINGGTSTLSNGGDMRINAKKRPPYLAIGTLVLLAVLVIFGIRFLFFRSTYETPLKKIVKSVENKDVKTLLDVIPDSLLDTIKERTGLDMDTVVSYFGDSYLNDLAAYTGDLKIDYEIEHVEALSRAEMKEIEDYFEGYLGTIQDAKELQFSYELYVDGELDEEGNTSVEVIKVDGKWYVNPEDFL